MADSTAVEPTVADKVEKVEEMTTEQATEQATEQPVPAVAAASEPAVEPVVEATEAKQETEEIKPVEPKQEDTIEEVKQEEAAQEEPAVQLPPYLASNPALVQLFEKLPAILSATGHSEMWGVPLKDSDDVPTVNVLIKFLRANEGNVKLAEEQLTKALQWRKSMNPIALIDGTYSASKFTDLGYITNYEHGNTVITWNLYGTVKDIEKTFGDVDDFIKWRVALMELAIKDLKLNEATSVIEYEGEDPYQMIQVHDYHNISFLRSPPSVRAVSKKTIEVFSTAYPELLREKYFVNVPAIMGWMYAAMKVFLSKNTVRKFHPISNGLNLARELGPISSLVPAAYGGSGPELQKQSKTVTLTVDEEPAKEEPAKEEPAKEEPAKEEPAKQEAAATTEAVPAATEA
ncbi:hypothetical protein ASPZODRAFT_130533 [Penicilliopsis zonata CBS 506.65]|uniref:Phosphatidylinositol transfer protein SFH5 n=1 Tax=Penicilliopsis zonata CBS 506.65 TaxID=1073090 RepID=A0A1L9SMR8_9EURO|nr:hypothetical protein ASPZODRAFT_130533 [Penicilliopsis zonata CBS 506.65]OJJ48488.1 hypothetical protein ASPZODRAFT_130533 [Penicilliopsis zonata CBS 506.65]